MQNDFVHRTGVATPCRSDRETISALPARLKQVADTVRTAGDGSYQRFTLSLERGEPFISEHSCPRPFLGKGDFTPGSFGHDLIDELQPADLKGESGFSAFYESRMDWTPCGRVLKR